MTSLFISDLHLETERPETIDLFCRYLAEAAAGIQRLYILGDLFEAWIGDDDDDAGLVPVVEALRRLTDRGVDCSVMHGNRDFLIGERFCAETGCRLLGDYATVVVNGEAVLLTHGDLLCTDDVDYLALRRTVRDPRWQSEFLAKPLNERRAIAEQLRLRSQQEVAAKDYEIMDVNQNAVESVMRRFGVRFLLHGHTHRPGIHRFDIDGADATRIVLGAWEPSGRVVRWDERGFELETAAA